MNYFKRKQENGITLIALIVTIIVLIILAVISMNAILGDDGIINWAQKARDQYEKAEQKEREDIGTLADELGTLLDKDKEVVLKVGDYVDYKPINGTFDVGTVFADDDRVISTEEALNWRILKADDTTLTLIADRPTTDELVLSYNNGVLLLNNICKTNYSNSTLNAVARSIKIEDVEEAINYIGTSDADQKTGGIGVDKEEPYPTIFLSEAYGSLNGIDYGTLKRSEQTEYIISTGEENWRSSV